MTETGEGRGIYFSLKELGLILCLSVLAALSGALVPSFLFPEGRISDFVYGGLGLPGPGAGVLVFGGILCFWLITGLILIKKPGTAIAISAGIIAFDLMFGNQVVLLQVMDVLFIVAVIIEAVCLAPVEREPWRNILPGCLAGLGLVTLVIALLGLATQGESDILLAQFPVTYYVFSLAGLCCAVICYRYPARYLLAAGVANMYYLLHFWLFWGDGFASRFPPDPMMIPVLLLVALLGGVLFASAAYGIGRFWSRYNGTGISTPHDQ